MAVCKDKVRPAFLFDVCSCSSSQFANFVSDLKLEIREMELISISFDFHHFLAIKGELLKALAIEDVKFIDISEDIPVLVSLHQSPSIRTMLSSVRDTLLNNVSDQHHDLHLASDWNGSTLFGVLCGYPYVYYFSGPSSRLSVVELLLSLIHI